MRFSLGIIVRLEGRDDLVVGLRRIESIDDLVDAIIVRARHRMPPLDFDRGCESRNADGAPEAKSRNKRPHDSFPL